jgi:hypothetical protein
MTKTKNETIMIEWSNCLFSENIYAYFQYGMLPVFSNSIDDLMLSDNYVMQKHESGSYEIFDWDEDAEEHLYSGRLFAPKAVELM